MSGIPGNTYGQKILGCGAKDCNCHPARNPDAPRKDLNAEYLRKREILEQIMIHEVEISILKEKLAK